MRSESEIEGHQRLLYAAIDDIGEAVRGNDAKAYAALVLHGLILAGLTTLVTALGPVYQQAAFVERLLGLGSLAVTLICFIRSAWALIEAVTPYHPEVLEKEIKRYYRHVFFPVDVYTANSPHGAMTTRLEEMGQLELRDELVAETLKLGDILKHESDSTARGYRILRYELVAAATFIVVVAISAL